MPSGGGTYSGPASRRVIGTGTRSSSGWRPAGQVFNITPGPRERDVLRLHAVLAHRHRRCDLQLPYADHYLENFAGTAMTNNHRQAISNAGQAITVELQYTLAASCSFFRVVRVSFP